jgi:outer membrane receptor for ferrienterochelin and colicins
MFKILCINFLIISTLVSSDLLEKITVTTGTRTAKILEDSPVKTQVVSSKEIQKMHATDVAEAIEYIPGILIKETHGKQGKGVWIQGLNSDRVLILKDGEPMTSSIGSTVDLSQLNINNIQKIEILKGATSALYGSSAMGGVVNIISKKAKKGISHSLAFESGTFANKGAKQLGLALFRASSQYKDDNISYSINFENKYESGIKLQEGNTYDLPQLNKISINGEFNFLNDYNIYIKPEFYKEDTSKPYTSFSPGIGTIKEEKIEDAYKYRFTVGGKYDFANESKLKFSTFFEKYVDDSSQDKVDTSYIDQLREAKISLFQSQIQFDTFLGEDHLITTGFSTNNENLEQTITKNTNSSSITSNELEENAKKSSLDYYIQDDWFINDDLELVYGTRYQYDSDFGAYNSPKLNLMQSVYLKNNHRLNIRLSYGNGYKVPNLKERFFLFDHSSLGYKVQGNKDLVPESSNSYQLGSELIKKGNYTLSLNFYYNDIKKLIETVKNEQLSQESGLNIYEYKNINNAYTQGYEFQYDFNINKNINIDGGYTYLNAKNKQTNKYLISRPKNQFKTRINFKHKKYLFVVSYSRSSKIFVDEDNLITSPKEERIDLKLTKQVSKLFKLYGGVSNVFDEHTDPNNHINDERTKRPRYMYLGMKYNF